MKIESLGKLSNLEKAAFAALTCERMFPLYEAFSKSCRFGNPDLYRQGISILYAYSAGSTASLNEYRRTLKKINLLVPDLNDFDETIASFGFDAALCLLEAFSFLVDRRAIHIENCSTHAIDTVDMFVQIAEDLDPNDSALDAKVNDNKFMVNEILLQNLLLNALLTHGVSEESVKSLRDSNSKSHLIELDVIGRIDNLLP